MANTAVKVSASPCHLTYMVTGDGTVAGPTILNATLLTDMVAGPLKDTWSHVFLTDGTSVQSAQRKSLLGGLQVPAPGAKALGFCTVEIQLMATGVDTTTLVIVPVADVDENNAGTTGLPELNLGMSDVTGQIMMVHLRYHHTMIQ
jgi:hypothetical protein